MQKASIFAALAAISAFVAPAPAVASAPVPYEAGPTSSAAGETEPDPASDKGQSIGARVRYVTIPKFVLNLFADGGESIDGWYYGLEYGSRSGSFEVVLSAMFGGYSMSPTFLKSKGEIIEGWELVRVDLNALYFTSSFLWSSSFSKTDSTFQILYGAETGLGFLFGNIFHTQAMPVDPNSKLDPSQTPWVPCPGVGAHPYCGDENEHFGNYSEPSWFNGGAKPVILPWISFNTGLLIRPSPKFSARLDLGYNLFNGPFVGLAGNFGI